jgi:hypothetical protein
MRVLIICCTAFILGSTHAQERFGIAHSNYGGADAAYLNPARPAGQWPYADFRLFGTEVFTWNSLVAWSDRERPLLGEVREGIAGNSAGNVIRRSGPGNSDRGIVQTKVLGPAFSLALGRGTIGAGVRSRVHTSVSGVSDQLANILFEGIDYAPQLGQRYQMQGLKVLGAAWTEVGVSYAHIIKAEGFGMLSAGTHLRYNIGHAAGAFQVTDLDLTVVDTAELIIHEASANYGFAMPAIRAGSGWGADLGMVYERTMSESDGYRPHQGSSGCTPMRYRYRIGVSLVDLGGIRYKNGEAGSIDAGSLVIADHGDVPIQDASDLDSLLATATGWKRSQGFSVGMPTGLSVQYDQRLADNTYIAFSAVQQLAGRNTMRLRRSNSMAITPRFETRYVEAALPVVFHEYDMGKPSIGFMLRFNGLVVGSDHIMPFLGKGDVYALDLYMRLRIMLFRSPACKGKRASGSHRSGSKDMIPCATPND